MPSYSHGKGPLRPQAFYVPLGAPYVVPAGPLPVVVRRAQPQPKPSRAKSRIVTPPAVYTASLKRPNVVRRTTPQHKPTRTQSRLLKPAAIVTAPPITPIVIQAKRAKPPTRAQSKRQTAAPYNSGGILPITGKAQQKRPKPTRATSRPLPAPSYNSGGQTPARTAAQQPKPKPLRKPPQRFTPPATAIVPPVAPIVTVGKRQKPPSRPQSKPSIAPLYNSSGILPTRIAAQQKTKPLRKPPQRFTPPTTAVAVPPTPIVVVAKRQRPPTRATSRPVLSAKYNGSGVRPAVTTALRRPPAKLRSLSHPVIAAPYNSGGFSPARIVRGVRRLNAPRTRGFSSPVVAPPSPVGSPLRYHVDSQVASTAISNQRPVLAASTAEPSTQATTTGAAPSAADSEPTTQQNTQVEGA